MTLPYLAHTTNNLRTMWADPGGARCVACLGAPSLAQDLTLSDESTVHCPLCHVDALVPAAVVTSEALLLEWHRLGFAPENDTIIPVYLKPQQKMTNKKAN